MSEPLTWADGFTAGQKSVRRKNQSGCCCMISDDGDKVLSPCQAHIGWLDEAMERRTEERATPLGFCIVCRRGDGPGERHSHDENPGSYVSTPGPRTRRG